MLGLWIKGNVIKSASDRKYGPERVTNGTFDSATGWLVQGESSISGGTATILSTAGAYADIQQASALVSGRTYRMTFDVISTNGVNLIDGPGTVVYPTSTTGSKVLTFVASGTTLVLKRNGVTNVTIDNVSIKEVL